MKCPKCGHDGLFFAASVTLRFRPYAVRITDLGIETFNWLHDLAAVKPFTNGEALCPKCETTFHVEEPVTGGPS